MLTNAKKKLGKLKMPAKRGGRGADMDLSSLMDEEENETPADEAAESPEHQAMEDRLGIEKHGRDYGTEDGDHFGEEDNADQNDRDESDESDGGDDMYGTVSDHEPDASDNDDMSADGAEGGEHSHYLEGCSDDELLAEIKKRGLMKQLGGKSAGKKPIPDAYGNEDDEMDHSLL